MVLWRYKILCFLLFGAAYCLFYLWPNFWPLFPPAFLPLSSIDLAVPFLPWTFLIYVSDYLVFVIAIYMLDLEGFNAFSRKMFLTLLICGGFFIFFPTAYPRPVYPENQPLLIHLVMNLVGVADSPLNCFPSMHVALTTVAAWSVRCLGRKTFIAFCVWAVAIFISTLTTKQHYLADIGGGLSVAVVATMLDWVLFQKRSLNALLERVRS